MPASRAAALRAGRGGERREHSWSVTIALAVAYAAAFAGAFAPFDAWPLILLAPAPLAWMAINALTTRRAVLVTFVASLSMWLWLDRWLVEVTLAGYPAKALYMTAYPVAFTWIVRRVARHARWSRLPMTIVVPVVWVGLEGARGELVFDGYPWFLLAHPLVEWPPLVQSADLLGAYFVSSIAAAVSGAIVDLLRRRAGRGSRATTIGGPLAAAVIVAANVAYGAWRVGAQRTLEDGPKVLAIQTNLPQSNKIGWSLEDQARDVASFLDLTHEAHGACGGDADLVVWPETMLPVRGLEPETLAVLGRWGQAREVAFAAAAAALPRALDASVLLGSPCLTGIDVEQDERGARFVWERNYNSAYLLGRDGSLQRYDKVLLTPFGEVMPYISAWPWLEERLLAIGAPGMSFALDAAPAPQRLALTARDGRVTVLGTPICFEDVVARVCRRLVYDGGVKRAECLVNLSNDGWFGSFGDGRRQHAQAARLRCVENRVPMVRCVNTGLSVAIDSRGYVVGRVGDGRYGNDRQAGWMETVVRLDRRTTLYGRVGEVWPWTCMVMTGGLVLASVREGRAGTGPR